MKIIMHIMMVKDEHKIVWVRFWGINADLIYELVNVQSEPVRTHMAQNLAEIQEPLELLPSVVTPT